MRGKAIYTGIQKTKIPNRKINRVYKIAETYPCFVSFFSSDSRIIRSTDEEMQVEVYTKLLGLFPTKWTGLGKKVRHRQITFTQTQGLFKGLTAIWSFQEVPDGTEVSIETSFSKPKIGILGEWVLGRFLVEKTTRKILQELKNKASLDTLES